MHVEGHAQQQQLRLKVQSHLLRAVQNGESLAMSLSVQSGSTGFNHKLHSDSFKQRVNQPTSRSLVMHSIAVPDK